MPPLVTVTAKHGGEGGFRVNTMMYVHICACIYVTERLKKKKLPLQFEQKGRKWSKTEAA